ncbi:MAG TPA: hypothetical protein VKX40_03110 [Aequorivita sp.]|nr:hypothetical protein [Aequorivita sp.]
MNTTPFWSWFQANEKKLRTIHTLPESEGNQLLYWFHQHLRYYSSKIGFQLIIATSSKKPSTLSFSTCGDYEVRQLILNLIESAPKFPNWIISAHISTLTDEEYEYFENEFRLNKINFNASSIEFWPQHIDPITNKAILGIILNFPTPQIDPKIVHQTVVEILKDTLGEKNYERYIADIIIHSDIPEDEALFELSELKQYLENL